MHWTWPKPVLTASMLKTIAHFVFIALSVTYPFVIYFGRNHLSPQSMALILLALLCLRAAVLGWKDSTSKWLLLIGILANLLTFFFDGLIGLLWYPTAINIAMLVMFGISLYHPPTFIERLARLSEPVLPEHAIAYTRNVTKVWCVFFLLNACISAWTVLGASTETWAFYNGFVSYLLMGTLFFVEWVIRYFFRKRHAV